MNKSAFSPFIRVATHSTLIAPFIINNRIIFDYEIIFVEDGLCNIIINNVPFTCKKNDVVFLRPGIEHKFECVDGTDFVQPHIHFDISYDSKSSERFVSFKPKDKMTNYELSLVQNDILNNTEIPPIFTPYDNYKFKKIFFEIITLYQNKDYNYEILYKAKMLELLDCIFRQFENPKPNGNNIIDTSVASVKNYIDNNYLSIITLDSLSEHFYLNKFTLLRKFKALYNQNVMSYYRDLRLKYAKEVLLETNTPIIKLCESLNFSDIYSFSRFFKSNVGCSPRLFRKKNGNLENTSEVF